MTLSFYIYLTYCTPKAFWQYIIHSYLSEVASFNWSLRVDRSYPIFSLMEEFEQQAITASLSSLRLYYDIFLSFRGEDTRNNITNSLYNALYSKGIRVFRDSEGLTQGDEISTGLIEAINDSAAVIAIISPNYASSRWCLEELATIYELGKLVLPLFYGVNPSDVRRQLGPFLDGFRDLERKFSPEKMARWRNAMERVGGVSGWVYDNG